jgi:beta-glucosidase-like glycosyl hydrolase
MRFLNICHRWGADPYLSGEATYEAIMGVQSQGVQATVKHALLK